MFTIEQGFLHIEQQLVVGVCSRLVGVCEEPDEIETEVEENFEKKPLLINPPPLFSLGLFKLSSTKLLNFII